MANHLSDSWPCQRVIARPNVIWLAISANVLYWCVWFSQNWKHFNLHLNGSMLWLVVIFDMLWCQSACWLHTACQPAAFELIMSPLAVLFNHVLLSEFRCHSLWFNDNCWMMNFHLKFQLFHIFDYRDSATNDSSVSYLHSPYLALPAKNCLHLFICLE